MAALTIDRIDVTDLRHRAGPGDDGLFVAVHGNGHVGWYGPVGGEPALCAARTLASAVSGRTFANHRVLHTALRQAVGPRPARSASWAIGAVDCAVWDLRGHLEQVPVAKILNPSSVSSVPLYASWLRLDLAHPSARDAVAEVGQGGWRFTKWGLRRDDTIEPGLDASRLAAAAQLVVDTLGTNAAFDAVFTWDEALARGFLDRIDRSGLVWLEDPLANHDLVSYQRIPGSTLAVGERLLLGQDASELLGLGLGAFTIDVVGCGGLTVAVEAVQLASAAGIPVFPHGRSLVPSAHLAAAFPQAVTTAEYQLQWEPARQRLYAEPWQPEHGRLVLPTRPGLGLTPRSR